MENKQTVRVELIVSGIFDIICSLPIIIFLLAYGAGFGISSVLATDYGYDSNVIIAVYSFLSLIGLAVTSLMLAFGIVTVTFCGKSAGEFKAKKNKIVASIVFDSLVLVVLLYLEGALNSGAGLFFWIISFIIASIVLKGIALGKKDKLYEAVSCQPAAQPRFVAAGNGNHKYPALTELQRRRESGMITRTEYEARRLEIVEAEDRRRAKLEKLIAERRGGRISFDEYETERRRIMDSDFARISENVHAKERPDIYSED